MSTEYEQQLEQQNEELKQLLAATQEKLERQTKDHENDRMELHNYRQYTLQIEQDIEPPKLTDGKYEVGAVTDMAYEQIQEMLINNRTLGYKIYPCIRYNHHTGIWRYGMTAMRS